MGPDWKESQIHGMGSYLGTWQSLAGVLWGQFSGLQCSVYCCRFAVQHGERLVSPSFIVLICKMDNNHTYQVGLGQENSWQHLCATCVWQEVMHLTRSLCSVLCFPRHWASVPIPWLARSEGACLKGPCHPLSQTPPIWLGFLSAPRPKDFHFEPPSENCGLSCHQAGGEGTWPR